MTNLYSVMELVLLAAGDHARPLDVDVRARFDGPGGTSITVAAFYDGGRTWRVRFAPTVTGEWSYITQSDAADTGLEGQSGRFTVGPASGVNALELHGGFLKVGPGGHHLTYTDGTPFFWLGDTWWFCPSDLVPIDRSNRPGVGSTYKLLVDTRAAQGYTVVQMASLGKLTPAGKDSGVSGEFLFTGELNTDYWRQYDAYIRYANEKGIVPALGFGFHQGLNSPTIDKLKILWRYVVARYGAHAVTWLICGEYNQAGGKDAKGESAFTAQDEARIAKILELGRFIKAADPYKRAMTVHPWWHGGDRQQAGSEGWHDFIMLQGGHMAQGPKAEFYRDLWSRTPAKPFLEGECTYEGIFDFTDTTVRQNAYKAMQCGSLGFTYGAQGLWYPNQDETDTKFSEWGKPVPWWAALVKPGGAQMKHLRSFYESIEWWRLRPVPADDALEAANLDPVSAGFPVLAAAVEPDLYVGYVPAHRPKDKGRPVTVVVRAGGAAPWRVEQFNPRTGERLACGRAKRGDAIVPAAPWNGEDWVIVLRP